ncbi:hypothetical protein MNBD_PLANCTO03-1090, partial [hydrothermal vent metagenome]
MFSHWSVALWGDERVEREVLCAKCRRIERWKSGIGITLVLVPIAALALA